MILLSMTQVAGALKRTGIIPKKYIFTILLSLIYTFANALKPIHVDDAAYYYYAAQVAVHPFDPYGFDIFWNQSPQPAHHVLAPPVLPYWWSIAIRCFGDQPHLWKLWMFPIVVIFVFSLHGLFRRFARGLDGPLVWITVLSPAFLPSLNLMLDIPSLALRLGGVLVFLRSCDYDSPRMAFVAGLACGLAIETKYTGIMGLGAILLYSALTHKARLGLTAVTVASMVFVAWESWIASRYGQSHFIIHMKEYSIVPTWELMFETLLTMVGGLAPFVTLLGLISSGLRGVYLLTVGIALFSPYFLLIFAQSGNTISPHLFLLFGFAQFATISGVLAWRVGSPPDYRAPLESGRRSTLFLLLWALLEVGGYFFLTPFLAVRRVMGVVVLAALLAGRLAAGHVQSPARKTEIRIIAAVSVALGVLFYIVDLRDASAQMEAVQRAAECLRRDRGGTAWFVGHWGFQFYAERAGMRPFVPGVSTLRQGDRLVVPDPPVNQQFVRIDLPRMHLTHTIYIRDSIPLRLVPGYYGDRSTTILEHYRGHRVTVNVYRFY